MTDNVILMPEPLETIGHRIDAAFARAQHGRQEWIEGTLDLAQAFADARNRFSSNNAFGSWCGEHSHDRVNSDDRAALINMAENLSLARIVLEETERRSWQLIWRHEMQDRFRSTTKTEPVPPPLPQPSLPSAPVAKIDEPRKNEPPSAPKFTNRSAFFNAPRAEAIAMMFQSKDARTTLGHAWTGRGGKQVWELVVKAYDAGLITPNQRGFDKPNLSLLFPNAPVGIAKQYDLTNQKQRTYIRDILLPKMIACRDKLLAEPERIREILNEYDREHQVQQKQAVVAEKRAVAVKTMSSTEQELVMFGQTVWPRIGINQGEYDYDQVRAAIWTFRDFESWNQLAKESPESHGRRIRNLFRYPGEYLQRADRDNRMARIFGLIVWFSRLMEKNPTADCKWPPYPHIEGQW